MNPFTWPGERFLLFYLVLAVVLAIACYMLLRRSGRDGKPVRVNDLTTDPYSIAYLRGGAAEAARVAIFNLVDRGILDFEGKRVHTVKPAGDATKALRRPLDRAIVTLARSPVTVTSLAAAGPVRKEAEAYAPALAAQGLVDTAEERRMRRNFALAALGVLVGVAFMKVAYALSRGRSNVAFLIILMVISCIVVLAISMRRRTGRGSEMLASVKTLLNRLHGDTGRLKAGGQTNEALLLAAAFGLAALPTAAFPVVEQMFPRPQGGGDSGGGSDSSSCSSSCGGGGGCGGCGGG
jgi:uncharacterized protein (TIGR04222 family)